MSDEAQRQHEQLGDSTILLTINCTVLFVVAAAAALGAVGLIVWGFVLRHALPVHPNSRWWMTILLAIAGGWIAYGTRRATSPARANANQRPRGQAISSSANPALYWMLLLARWSAAVFLLLAPLWSLVLLHIRATGGMSR